MATASIRKPVYPELVTGWAGQHEYYVLMPFVEARQALIEHLKFEP